MGRSAGSLCAVDVLRVTLASFLFAAWVVVRQHASAIAHAIGLALSFSHLGHRVSAFTVPHVVAVLGQWGALLSIWLAGDDTEAYVWTGTAWAYCLTLAGARAYTRRRHGGHAGVAAVRRGGPDGVCRI